MEFAFSVDDVTLIPKFSTVKHRSDVDLSLDLGKGIKVKFPIMPANMRDITGPKMARKIAQLGGLALLHRFQNSIQDRINDYTESIRLSASDNDQAFNGDLIGCSLGIKEEDMKFAKIIVEDYGCKILCIDVAHAHSEHCLKFCEELANWLQKKYPNNLLIAGNIATSEGAFDLFDCGVEIIKVGISSGSICDTRQKSGNGCSTWWSTKQVFDYFKDYSSRPKIISDGGCKNSSDLVKLLCYSDLVMAGRLFAGTDEANGEIIYELTMKENLQQDIKIYKDYHGSSTMRQDGKHIEGIKTKVPCIGPVENVINELCEGIQSGCAYQGVHNLEELKINPTFVQVSNLGMNEGLAK